MEQIIERIRKLFALAKDGGATEGERDAAIAKASELMFKYNLENWEELKKGDDGIYEGERMKGYKYEIWTRYVTAAVATLYGCKAINYGKGGDVQFYGRRLDVMACEETFRFVCDQIEELYKQALIAFKGANGGWLSVRTRGEFRKTFKEGAALKVFRRAKEIVARQRNQIPDHMALVVIDQMQDKLTERFEEMGTKTKTVSVRKFGHGTGAGMAAGASIKLQDKVS